MRSAHTLVLDDDPTGSQAVHDVQVVLTVDAADIADGLRGDATATFVLINTRGLPEPDAIELNRSAVRTAMAVDPELEIVSRSDSTLRGHVVAEVRAIDQQRAASTGHRVDGVLFAPAFFEAGRFTSGDVHYATVGGEAVPVGETEFARDATFGYTASDLRDFLVERTDGAIARDDVRSVSLEDIAGGPDAVRDILLTARDGCFIVVNGTEYAHYETVVLGLQAAIDAGRTFLYRTGPSFVRALTGIEPMEPLGPSDFPDLARAAGHGLVVVGSHVSQTSRQIEAAQRAGRMGEYVLSVPSILAGEAGYLERATAEVRSALADDDLLLYTSRDLIRGADAADSLEIARMVSTALSTVVAGALDARPAWVIAKGGITSHDIAVRGLGIRRARVAGQLRRGMISVFEPIVSSPQMQGVPYVVFAGNVGDDDTLAQVMAVLRSAQGVAAGRT